MSKMAASCYDLGAARQPVYAGWNRDGSVSLRSGITTAGLTVTPRFGETRRTHAQLSARVVPALSHLPRCTPPNRCDSDGRDLTSRVDHVWAGLRSRRRRAAYLSTIQILPLTDVMVKTA